MRKGNYRLKVEKCGLQQYFSADDRERASKGLMKIVGIDELVTLPRGTLFSHISGIGAGDGIMSLRGSDGRSVIFVRVGGSSLEEGASFDSELDTMRHHFGPWDEFGIYGMDDVSAIMRSLEAGWVLLGGDIG